MTWLACWGNRAIHQVFRAIRASSSAAIACSYSRRKSGSAAAASSLAGGISASMRTGLCAVARHNA